MLRRAAGAVSARTACSTDANGPRSTLAAPSIPVSPARTSNSGWLANARSTPVSAIRIPAAARTGRRPQRAAAQALASPESEAAASPMPRASPIRNGERPRCSRSRPMSTAENPNPNERSPRAVNKRNRSTQRCLLSATTEDDAAGESQQHDDHEDRDQRVGPRGRRCRPGWSRFLNYARRTRYGAAREHDVTFAISGRRTGYHWKHG